MWAMWSSSNGGLHLLGLAIAGASAWVVDDGAAAGNNGGVLDEAAVGILFHCGKHGNVHATLLQGFDVGVMLLNRLLVNRLAQLGCAGDAGAADNNVGKLSHGKFLSLRTWLQSRVARLSKRPPLYSL